MTLIIVPGLHSSGPEHWQSRWERERDDCIRADLGVWDNPNPVVWIARLARTVGDHDGPSVLVAHSLGCLAVAWWANGRGDPASKVLGALLVAPPDPEREGADARLRRFAPVPRQPLPFPAIVVASRNDPYATITRSKEMAANWSARFHDAGDIGHINVSSGLGSWSEGQELVKELLANAALVEVRSAL